MINHVFKHCVCFRIKCFRKRKLPFPQPFIINNLSAKRVAFALLGLVCIFSMGGIEVVGVCPQGLKHEWLRKYPLFVYFGNRISCIRLLLERFFAVKLILYTHNNQKLMLPQLRHNSNNYVKAWSSPFYMPVSMFVPVSLSASATVSVSVSVSVFMPIFVFFSKSLFICMYMFMSMCKRVQ
jgi:hypothetical protein